MMRTELFNAFIVAAGKVLGSETDVSVQRGSLQLQRDAYVTDDITVLISVVGDIWGIIIISLSFDTAKALISQMLGQKITQFSELAQSGIGELGNVIVGQASTKLAEVGYNTDISVPTLIVGKGSNISTLDIDRLVVPLETKLGTVRLNLALRMSQSDQESWPRQAPAMQVAMPNNAP